MVPLAKHLRYRGRAGSRAGGAAVGPVMQCGAAVWQWEGQGIHGGRTGAVTASQRPLASCSPAGWAPYSTTAHPAHLHDAVNLLALPRGAERVHEHAQREIKVHACTTPIIWR